MTHDFTMTSDDKNPQIILWKTFLMGNKFQKPIVIDLAIQNYGAGFMKPAISERDI